MADKYSFKSDARVLMTGVGSGLGLALARCLLDGGAEVASLGRSYPSVLAEQPRSRHVAVDFSRLDQIDAALGELCEGSSCFDLVLLNAGVLPPMADIGETSLATINGVMDVNTWANKVLLDGLRARAIEVRQVVAISSGAAVRGNRGWNAYALSKAALNMLMQLYAREWTDTHFCSLAPGLVDTGMQDYLCTRSAAQVQRFPSLARIQAARGTDAMPSPEQLAPRLLGLLEGLRARESGEFVDIRKL